MLFATRVGRHGPRRALVPDLYLGRHLAEPLPVSPVEAVEHRASDTIRAGLLVVGLLAAVWFTQRPLTSWTSAAPWLNFYVAQPLIWAALATAALRLYRKLPDSLPFSWTLMRIAFIAGVFQASSFVVTGLVAGFGDNPSSGELSNIPLNVLHITALVAGVESTRAVVFRIWGRTSERVAFVAVTAIFATAAIPIGQFDLITDLDSFFRVGVGRYLPALALSGVLTSFTATGGIGVSAAFRWPLMATVWLFPILPALDWPMRSLLETALPLVGLAIARSLYEGTRGFSDRYPDEVETSEDVVTHRRWPRWALAGAIGGLIVLFASGIFGVRPYLLSGISMEPSFQRGDVVIVQEVPTETLKVSDVVTYRQSSSEFVHRITEIREEAGERLFITKGDNVRLPDPPVSADLVSGKVVFVLPKVGLPSLWIRDVVLGG